MNLGFKYHHNKILYAYNIYLDTQKRFMFDAIKFLPNKTKPRNINTTNIYLKAQAELVTNFHSQTPKHTHTSKHTKKILKIQHINFNKF